MFATFDILLMCKSVFRFVPDMVFSVIQATLSNSRLVAFLSCVSTKRLNPSVRHARVECRLALQLGSLGLFDLGTVIEPFVSPILLGEFGFEVTNLPAFYSTPEARGLLSR